MSRKTTIDIGPSAFEWQSIPDLAKQIGVANSAIYMALDDGRPCNGYEIEACEPDADLRGQLGIDGRTKRVARVVREGNRRTAVHSAKQRLDDDALGEELEQALSADSESDNLLAVAEATIEDLEQQLQEKHREVEDLGAQLHQASRVREKLGKGLAELGEDFQQCEGCSSSVHQLWLAPRDALWLCGACLQGRLDEAPAASDPRLHDVAWEILCGELDWREGKQRLAQVLRRSSR